MSNVFENVVPGSISPASNVSLVTLCCSVPVLRHTTVSPALASTRSGLKPHPMASDKLGSTMLTGIVAGPFPLRTTGAGAAAVAEAARRLAGAAGGGPPVRAATRTTACIQGCGVQW